MDKEYDRQLRQLAGIGVVANWCRLLLFGVVCVVSIVSNIDNIWNLIVTVASLLSYSLIEIIIISKKRKVTEAYKNG